MKLKIIRSEAKYVSRKNIENKAENSNHTAQTQKNTTDISENDKESQ